jgi:hypothetical protein
MKAERSVITAQEVDAAPVVRLTRRINHRVTEHIRDADTALEPAMKP